MTDREPDGGWRGPPWARRRWDGRAGWAPGGPGSADGAATDGRPFGPPWRRRHRGGAWFLGCLVVALIAFVGVVTALATWVAAALLGVVAPDAAPPTLTAVTVLVVLVVAVLVGIRVFGGAVRPVAEIAAASDRLADGEAGVRVRPRGPGPVRGLGASFNAMAERLDRSREDRRALLADVTHELRTPLTVISGGLEAMLDGVHPMDEDHVAPILAQAEVMDRLLDDLRTLSLAEAGALPLYREPTDLAEVADDVVAAHAALAAATGIGLASAGDATLVTSVDPVRVHEIVANLVTNALRHTGEGGHVTVDVRRDGGDAVITVVDTGEGIAADDLDRVFDRFHRRADSGGSGLGLAIVRDLATAHGGSVEVESEGVPGRGSTFRVRLPIRD